MTKKVIKILKNIKLSGESAALSVVDHLETIALQGSETKYLIDEAENLILWAKKFIIEVTPEPEQIVICEQHPEVTEPGCEACEIEWAQQAKRSREQKKRQQANLKLSDERAEREAKRQRGKHGQP